MWFGPKLENWKEPVEHQHAACMAQAANSPWHEEGVLEPGRAYFQAKVVLLHLAAARRYPPSLTNPLPRKQNYTRIRPNVSALPTLHENYANSYGFHAKSLIRRTIALLCEWGAESHSRFSEPKLVDLILELNDIQSHI